MKYIYHNRLKIVDMNLMKILINNIKMMKKKKNNNHIHLIKIQNHFHILIILHLNRNQTNNFRKYKITNKN